MHIDETRRHITAGSIDALHPRRCDKIFTDLFDFSFFDQQITGLVEFLRRIDDTAVLDQEIHIGFLAGFVVVTLPLFRRRRDTASPSALPRHSPPA